MRIPTIQSEGPPPERHAARVVREMAHWLRIERDRLHVLMVAALRGASLGNPKSQQRAIDRLTAVGIKALMHMHFESGKRGKFTLWCSLWEIYDPINDKIISKPEDQTPDQPWLACMLVKWEGLGNYRTKHDARRMFALTHHAMQRLAERSSVCTPDDLLMVMVEIHEALVSRMDAAREKGKPRQIDKHIPVPGGVAIVEWEDDCGMFVVKTVLSEKMHEENQRRNQ